MRITSRDDAIDRVSIAIVTFKSDDVLSNCLGSLFAVYGNSPEIVVVDNGQSRRTEEVVRGYSNVKYVPSTRNVGFAGGNNLALRYVTRELVLLLNDDTVFYGDSISPLVDFMDGHANAGIVQGTMNRPSDNTLDSCGEDLMWYGLQKHFHLGCPTATTELRPRRVFAVKGAMLMFRRAILKDTGGFLFYDHFVNYYEETDFCHRANLAGWECWFVPTLPIDHIGGYTSSRLSHDEIWTQYIANILFSFSRNFGILRKVTTLPVFFIGVFVFHPIWTVKALNKIRRLRK